MGKAKWWVCSDCKSLNDLPANKCYKCHVEKPASARLIDDQYSEVGSAQTRVGITVDLSKLAELTTPDPLETAKGGGVIEAFRAPDAQPTGTGPATSRTSDAGWPSSRLVGATSPRPLRDPTPRSISEVGNRPWADVPPPPDPPQPAAAPAGPQPAARPAGPQPPGYVRVAPPRPPGYAPAPPLPGPPPGLPPPPGFAPPPQGAPPRPGSPPAPGYPRPPGYATPAGAPGGPPMPPPGTPAWPPSPPPARETDPEG